MSDAQQSELEIECPLCDGTGVIDKSECPHCGGTHYVPTENGEALLAFLNRHFNRAFS